jgi:hypothetical protein
MGNMKGTMLQVESKGAVDIFQYDTKLKKSSKSNFDILDAMPKHKNVLSTVVPGDSEQRKIIPWGKNNDLPSRYTDSIYSNHIAPQLLSTRRDQVLGQGLFFYRETVTDGPDNAGGAKTRISIAPADLPEGKKWLTDNRVRNVLRKLESNRNQIGNAFLLIELDVKGTKIFVKKISSIDAHMVRIQEADAFGKVAGYFVSRDWKDPNKYNPTYVPAYNEENPTAAGIFMVHLRDEVPGFAYYDPPAWVGATTAIQVSNLFWAYYFNRIDKAYALRYLIRIDWQAFESGYDEAQNLDDAGKPVPIKQAKAAFVKKINDYLEGADGATTLYTGFVGGGSERLPMVTVEVLAKAAGDDLYLDLAKQADVALASGFGIDPALANVATGGGLGRSGSELRISFQVDLAMHCQSPRQILLEPFNRIIKPLLDWWPEDVYLGIEDVDITTIADNPTGREAVATPVG